MINTIYFIDQSIKKEFSIRTPNIDEDTFFQDLASAHQHGYCYLCGDPISLNYLCQHQSGITKNIYNIIRNRHVENGAAMSAVKQVFILTYQQKPELSSLPQILQEENKCYFIYIPTAIKLNWRLPTECCLLTENLEDSKFYLFMAKYYCQNQNIPCHQIRFHQEHGGGDTICDVFIKCVSQEKMPVLCLVDSDRKHGPTKAYPNKPTIGNTLDRIQKATKKLSKQDDPPFSLFPLHVHEIENLIPSDLLKQLCHESLRSRLDRISQLRNIKSGEPLLYYDYKSGFPYIKSAPQRAYWKEVLIELGGDITSMPSQIKLKPGTYDPDALFFPPLDAKLLSHILNRLQSKEQEDNTRFKILQIDDYLKSIWNDVGVQMLTWGYVNEPVRA